MIRRGRMRLDPAPRAGALGRRERGADARRRRSDDGRSLALGRGMEREEEHDGRRDREAALQGLSVEGGPAAATATPSYEAWVYSPRDGRRSAGRSRATRRHAPGGPMPSARSTTAACGPRPSRRSARRRRRGSPAPRRARSATAPAIRTSRRRCAGYRQALEERVLPLIGGEKLSAITTSDLQLLVDRWHAEGQPASTLRNTIKPLQAIYRRAKSRGGPARQPDARSGAAGAAAPQGRDRRARGRRDAARGAACRGSAVWGTALYAGPSLRRAAGAALERRRRRRGHDRGARVLGSEGGVDRSRRRGPRCRRCRCRRRCASCCSIAGSRLRARRGARSCSGVGGRSRSTRRRCTAGRTPPGARRAERAAAPAPGAAHLRLVHDRRRRQRQGARAVHGPLLDQGDLRSVRPPDAGVGAGGGGAARCVPGAGEQPGSACRRERILSSVRRRGSAQRRPRPPSFHGPSRVERGVSRPRPRRQQRS